MRVPIFDLSVTDRDLRSRLLEAVGKVLDHGRVFLGPEVEEFEERVARDVGTKFAVGVGSGSSALYMSLLASGIGPGDEVITTPLSWIISSNAIRACGAIPVFADIGRDFNIDPESIEQNISTRTRAILAVHYAGHLCDMRAISNIADKAGLIIIEDAAQAYGAEIHGRKAGSFARAGALSMNPMKVLGGFGEAGAVVTDDEHVYQKLKILRHAGTTSDPARKITNDCHHIALNHKIDTINAAMLLVILDQLPERMRKRELIACRYNHYLPKQVVVQKLRRGETAARYVYPIQVPHRDALRKYLEAQGIETKIMHEPLICDAPAYQDLPRPSIPVARGILASSLVIPANEKLEESAVDYVIEKVLRFYS
jgi:dTDP-4-amino-4,6-dideoxygalactose transaminase